MIKNADKCVFVDKDKLNDDAATAITDAAVKLQPGKILVYQLGRHGNFPRDVYGRDAVKIAAMGVASRLKLALVQWPNGPAHDSNRTWCFGLQKPA